MQKLHYLLVLLAALSSGCHRSRLSPAEMAASHQVDRRRQAEAAFLVSLKAQCDGVYPKYTVREGVRRLLGVELWQASPSALVALREFPEMEELGFVATDLRTFAFGEVGKLTNLKSLRATNCKLLPEQLKALQNLTELEHLELMFTAYEESSEKRVQLLGELTPDEVQRRDALARNGTWDGMIQGALLTDRGMPYLSRLTKLKTLELINTHMTVEGLKHLQHLVDLEVADVGVIGLNGKATSPLQGLTKLRRLRYFDADDEIISALSEISSLEDLEIWSGGVTDAGAKHLLKLKKLQRLQIRGNQMTDQGLETLTQLPELEYLDLSYVKHISESGIARFLKLRPDVNIKQLPPTRGSASR